MFNLCCLILLFISFPVLSWCATTSDDLRVVRSDATRLTIEIAPPSYRLSVKKIGTAPYDQVILPGYGEIHEAGKPQLPVRGALIGIPENADIMLTVTGTEYESFYLKHDHLPAIRRNENGLDIPGANHHVYRTDAFYPGFLAVKGFTGYMRDQRVLQILFYPVQYHPVSREVRIYKKIIAEVVSDVPFYSAENPQERAKVLTKKTPGNAYEKLLQNSLLNYDSLGR